jgi:hypothetical protein
MELLAAWVELLGQLKTNVRIGANLNYNTHTAKFCLQTGLPNPTSCTWHVHLGILTAHSIQRTERLPCIP